MPSKESGMHVHNIQFDPNLQLGALYASAHAEAKKEAERVRNKLTQAASSLAGDYEEDCVVSLSGDQGPEQDQQSPQGESENQPQANASSHGQPAADPAIFSDWA
jgi:hypothetical protein